MEGNNYGKSQKHSRSYPVGQKHQKNHGSHAPCGCGKSASGPRASHCHPSLADRLAQVLYGLQTRLRFEDVDLPLLRKREVRTVGLLVISGDRGLCGAYNSNVIRRAENRAKELKAEGLDYKFVIVGRKALQYFQRRDQPIDASYTGLEQVPTAKEASEIA